jgi:hypothetical protein
VNELLRVNAPVSLDELVSRVNDYSGINTFSAQVENVIVRNYFTDKKTEAEEFPAASGQLRFKRPEKTRMQVSFIGKTISDMTSDGTEFHLAIYYPDDKKKFIHGSNLKDLERMNAHDIQSSNDPEISRAGGLINMRPQHITDSVLIKAISPEERRDVFREEVQQVEPDTRPGAKNRLVTKTYYVVYVIERGDAGQAKLRRKFWFDRTAEGTPLVRQQVFENGEGRLASDITYSDWSKLPNSDRLWAGTIVIDRRNDGYQLKLEIAKDSIETNVELPAQTFQLMNERHLDDLDLDAPRNTKPQKADAGSQNSDSQRARNANHR